MIRILTRLLFSVLLVTALLPTKVVAITVQNYSLWVGGVRVTSENASGVTGSGITGTVTYSPERGMLTLDNATITEFFSDQYYSAAIYSGFDINITLIGTNVIKFTPPDLRNGAGIFGYDRNITIGGNGSLDITLGPSYRHSYGIYSEYSSGISYKNINIDGPTLTITTGNTSNTVQARSCGLCQYSSGTISIKNSTVTINAGDTVQITGSVGIQNSGTLEVVNSTVIASAYDRAIWNQKFTVSDSIITASTSKDGSNSSIVTTDQVLSKSYYKYVKIEDKSTPTLTLGVVNRSSDTEGTIKFSSSEPGSYYYAVVEDGATPPDIDTSGPGIAFSASDVTISNPDGLSAGAKDIYVRVKDDSGNSSAPLKIDIPDITAARATAISVINSAYGSYVQGDYSAGEWIKLVAAKEAAITAINSATTPSAVDNAKTSGLRAMDNVLTAVEELAAAKTAANSVINNTYGSYIQSNNYSDKAWIELEMAKEAAQLAINNATSLSGVDSAKTSGLSAMDKVLTASEEQALATAKTSALAEINSAYESYIQSDYSAGEWTKLIAAKETAITAINNATSLSEVDSAKTGGLSAMDKVLTVTEEQALAAAKSSALAEINSAYESYIQSDYSAGGWTKLTAAKETAITAINRAASLSEVDSAKASGLDAMDKVLTAVEELAVAKTVAISVINSTYESYVQSDYREVEWTKLTVAKETAITAINNATSLSNVESAETSGLDAMDKILTVLEELEAAKTTANSVISNAYGSYVQSDYSETGWTKLTAAKESAITEITSTTSLSVVDSAKTSGLDAMDAVLTAVEELAAAKTAALAEINSTYLSYETDDYSVTAWADLAEEKTKAISAINNAASLNEVDSAKTGGLSAMDKVLTVTEELALAEARTVALAEISNAYESYIQSDYSAGEWTKLILVKEAANTAINRANSLSDVSSAKTSGLDAMDKVLTAVEELAAAKTAAISVINSAYGSYVQSDYGEAEWTKLTAAKETTITAINQATSLSEVDSTKISGLDAMDKAQTAVEELAAAKTAATSVINNAYGNYAQSDYSTRAWIELGMAKEAAISAINSSTSLKDVESAKAIGLDAMEKVLTIIDELALAEAKNSALSDINSAYGSYVQSDYSEEGWTKLMTAKDSAIKAINSATNLSDVDSAKTGGLSAMDKVLTAVEELAGSKNSALSVINSAYGNYKADDYSYAAWANLTAAKNSAITEIDSATSLSDVDSAKTSGLSAMDAVLTAVEEAAAQVLSEAKIAAISEVNRTYLSYDADDYSVTTWADLSAAKIEAISAINRATSLSDVGSTKTSGLDAMEAVLTVAEELETAKTAAISIIISAYGSYDTDEYSTAARTHLTAVKDSAITAINSATSRSDVDGAKTNGLNAMDSVLIITEKLGIVENASYPAMSQSSGNTVEAIKAALKVTAQATVNDNSVTVTINQVSYTAPTAGTADIPNGNNGTYVFTVTLSKGGVSQTSTQKSIIINATAYTATNSDLTGISQTSTQESITINAIAYTKNNSPRVEIIHKNQDIGTKAEGLIEAVSFKDSEKADDISIKLEIVVIEENDVTPEDKALIDGFVQDTLKVESPKLYVLDISLFKVVGANRTAIKTVDSEITIRFTLPEAYRGTEFSIVRIHEGVVEKLDTTYNEATFEVSFKTDKFSTYSVVASSKVSEALDPITPVEEAKSDTNLLRNVVMGLSGMFVTMWLFFVIWKKRKENEEVE